MRRFWPVALFVTTPLLVSPWAVFNADTEAGAGGLWRLYASLQAVLSGELRWSDLAFLGTPVLEDSTFAALYPLRLLMAPLSIAGGLAVFMYAHLVIAQGSLYALARQVGVSRGGAAFGAAIYGFSAPMLGAGADSSFVVAGAWAPLLVLFALRAMLRRGRWSYLGAAAVGGVMITGGALHLAVAMGAAIVVLHGAWSLLSGSRRPAIVGGITVVVALLAGAAQLFVASPGASASSLSAWKFSALSALFVPSVEGAIVRCGFIGVLGVAVVVIASRPDALVRAWVVLFGIALLSLPTGWGASLVAAPVAVPGRLPLALAVAVLGAVGLDQLLRRRLPSPAVSGRWIAAAAIGLALVEAAVVLRVARPAADATLATLSELTIRGEGVRVLGPLDASSPLRTPPTDATVQSLLAGVGVTPRAVGEMFDVDERGRARAPADLRWSVLPSVFGVTHIIMPETRCGGLDFALDAAATASGRCTAGAAGGPVEFAPEPSTTCGLDLTGAAVGRAAYRLDPNKPHRGEHATAVDGRHFALEPPEGMTSVVEADLAWAPVGRARAFVVEVKVKGEASDTSSLTVGFFDAKESPVPGGQVRIPGTRLRGAAKTIRLPLTVAAGARPTRLRAMLTPGAAIELSHVTVYARPGTRESTTIGTRPITFRVRAGPGLAPRESLAQVWWRADGRPWGGPVPIGGVDVAGGAEFSRTVDLPVNATALTMRVNALGGEMAKLVVTGADPCRLRGYRRQRGLGAGYALYDNPRALPRVYTVSVVAPAPSVTEARAMIRGSQVFKPGEMAFAATKGDLPGFAPAPIETARFDGSSVEVRINARRAAAYLVINDRYAPGWVATIDGEPAPVIRTNGIVRGVVVPRGRHTVRMTYAWPAGFLAGVLVSLGSLLFAAFVLPIVDRRWLPGRERRASTVTATAPERAAVRRPGGARPLSAARRAQFRRIALVIGLVLAALGAEVMARVYFAINKYGFEAIRQRLAGEVTGVGAAGDFLPQAYLLYVSTPNPPPPDGSPPEHNAYGFRGPAPALKRTPGVARVLCIGGSTTYSISVDTWRDAYPAQLEKILNAKRPAGVKRVEVINGGVTAATTAEVLAHYHFKFRFFGADVVVINTGGNDGDATGAAFYQPDYSHGRQPLQMPQPLQPIGRALLKSRVTAWLVIQLLHGQTPGNARLDRQPGLPPDTLWHPGSRKATGGTWLSDDELGFTHNLDVLVDEVIEDGAKVVLVPFRLAPGYEKTWASASEILRNERVLKAIGKRRNVPVAPFTHAAVNPTSWVDNCHVDARGTKKKAAHIAPYVQRALWSAAAAPKK